MSISRIYTGGCQCGAVRYRVEGTLSDPHLCHCRMCQKAAGNYFLPLANAPRARFSITRGTPGWFQSSEIVRRGFEEGWVRPVKPERRTGRSVAVVGSGPAGLAAAQQLNRAGHTVTLFEKNDRIGGLLRYGIPDFKLEKWLIDRRLAQLRGEGVFFQTGVHVGVDLSARDLRKGFDAILLCTGAERPRDLPVPGRELGGVHFAMEFLTQQNRRVAGDEVDAADAILATGKHVVVLGGGDTGSDCVGTSHRQRAASVTSIELLPQPPQGRHLSEPWPLSMKYTFSVSSSHAEGGEREYALATKDLVGRDGRVRALRAVRVPLAVMVGARDEFLDRPAQALIDASAQHAGAMVAFTGRIVPGASHGFQGREAALATALVDWIRAARRGGRGTRPR